ncbi:MAG TPA: LacI family DNA-binding transcriptional regulator [Actinophytocola sp.]|uniref:LacI family DNA-binding transcriptional regulator n=1 Tax=Actinophytocola sp. TaxID=1872138 RepID=UPI002DC054C7|nr:LacI family DNA-binding transcriptional regulator [Actinophytocola sp.]HEU5472353.1 LacI family DNA-binding transcriptional regulator [Actinophytocola sp.]
MRRPTIADIARRAGVSKGAVSYALNDRPGVSSDTRQRILAIAEEIGWRPNSAARALSGAAANAIGLAIRRPARVLGIEPFFMELVSGMEAVLSEAGSALMLQVVGDVDTELALYRRWWGERRIDGAILTDLRAGDPRVGLLEELGLPAVIVGGPTGVGTLPHCWADETVTVTETVGYLAALGHRRIGRVAGMPDLLHTRHRDSAFRTVGETLGVDTSAVISTDYTGEEGAHATRTMLSAAARPTAILFDNDIMAVAGLSVAHEMGLAVPRDLSIVAWDDSPLCQVLHPPLTALTWDIPAYGARAAELLRQVIAEAERAEAGVADSGHSVQVAHPRLTPRGSTAPPA